MTRRTDAKGLIRVTLVRCLLLLALSGASCQTNRPAQSRHEKTVTHVVVCWLKSPGDQTGRQRIIIESKAFVGQIPGLLHVTAGRALPSTRPSVDSSYDVAIVMTFRDAEALRAYNDHPKHKAAVENVLRPLVGKLVIYDFVDGR